MHLYPLSPPSGQAANRCICAFLIIVSSQRPVKRRHFIISSRLGILADKKSTASSSLPFLFEEALLPGAPGPFLLSITCASHYMYIAQLARLAVVLQLPLLAPRASRIVQPGAGLQAHRWTVMTSLRSKALLQLGHFRIRLAIRSSTHSLQKMCPQFLSTEFLKRF